MFPLSLNAQAKHEIRSMGREGAPLLIVDDAIADPGRLVDHAQRAPFTPVTGQGNHFPGVRSPADPSYAAALHELLRQHLEPVFGIAASASYHVNLCHLQIVCTEPQKLSLPQRLPHFDTFEPRQIALLHYLTHDDQGGTNFYRHRSTGYERITADRFKPYTQELVREVTTGRQPDASYVCGDTEQFEVIEAVRPAFNRVIAYFSNSLHSGHIAPDHPLSSLPSEGRLTATVFLNFEA